MSLNPEPEFTKIEARCMALGIPIQTLCAEAEVLHQTVSRWKKSPVKSFETLRALNSALDRLEAKVEQA